MANLSVDIFSIQLLIHCIRDEKVILDRDLAKLYGVETKVLLRAVRRNLDRFPVDFMFQLTNQEFKDLRSQSGTSSQWGGRRYPPYAFSEQGVAMLSTNAELSARLEQLELKYDKQFFSLRCTPTTDAGIRHA